MSHVIGSHLPFYQLRLRYLILSLVMLGSALVPAQAPASDVTVASPVNGSKTSSPVLIRAHTTGCNGFAPTAFGYSVDDSKSLQLGETAYDIDVTNDPIPAGPHTVHFKSWTTRGNCPTVSTAFTVVASSPSGIPPNAISSGDLDSSGGWSEIHDGGTPGKSKGTTSYPVTTPLYDDARKFYMTYSARAGERWATDIAVDKVSTYFVLDAYVMLANPSQVLNLELDVNHTTADDNTVILGTQCSGVTKTWEYAWTALPHLDHWWSTKLASRPNRHAP
jgi:hypothetical protein